MLLIADQVLTRPLRHNATEEMEGLGALLSRLDLRPADEADELAAATRGGTS